MKGKYPHLISVLCGVFCASPHYLTLNKENLCGAV